MRGGGGGGRIDVWLRVVNPSPVQLRGGWTGGWVGVFLVLAVFVLACVRECVCAYVCPRMSGPGWPAVWWLRGETETKALRKKTEEENTTRTQKKNYLWNSISSSL